MSLNNIQSNDLIHCTSHFVSSVSCKLNQLSSTHSLCHSWTQANIDGTADRLLWWRCCCCLKFYCWKMPHFHTSSDTQLSHLIVHHICRMPHFSTSSDGLTELCHLVVHHICRMPHFSTSSDRANLSHLVVQHIYRMTHFNTSSDTELSHLVVQHISRMAHFSTPSERELSHLVVQYICRKTHFSELSYLVVQHICWMTHFNTSSYTQLTLKLVKVVKKGAAEFSNSVLYHTLAQSKDKVSVKFKKALSCRKSLKESRR